VLSVKSGDGRMKKGSNNISVASSSFRYGAASDIGKVRDENQDTFMVDTELPMFLVSDGMGGHRGGARASKIVAEVLPGKIGDGLRKRKARSTTAIRSMLKRTIVDLSRHLRAEDTNDADSKGMGATLVVALVRNDRAYIANMGDSRGYLFRSGRLSQITEDHSVVSALVRDGRIDPDQARDHPANGQITRYIGMENEVTAHVRTFALKAGDRVLLCTDGLTDVIGDDDIRAVLSDRTDPQTACEAFVDAANAAGGYDNVTVMIIDWSSEADPE